ncbi:cytochrome b561 [Rhodothalassium salexigens DSM 2132]|uniref:Cytochrome b561 n=1 Tax=Rhodothalassium salexigens DSM 2132 TaxID=1188247 RepID=A0A4R2PPD6_RHOSA|nr:cytochrome b [Rhodothalassium salexigens]MBB4210835.1 cytochrome b561 [Rhodothalassium salexigens DSM 2132]MBK1640133.1 hypothetical protein [Rhodothalassium salexigens DSM 2132]TCP37610.1 cytochrome b561 [Rhodothalassium salexigens DSM 2132]
MQWRNSRDRWGAAHKALHWTMAALILALLGVGFVMANLLPDSAWQLKLSVYQWHKAGGLLALALVGGRLVWRGIGGPVPGYPAGAPAWQRRTAALAHVALYAAMIAMPATGYLMASASSFPVLTWTALPDPLGQNERLEALFGRAHMVLGLVFAGLIALHGSAALKHHLVDRQDVLKRMLPGRRP